MKIADFIAAAVGLLLCAAVWLVSSDFPKDVIMKIGPEFFPRIVAAGMGLACVALVVNALHVNSDEQAPTLSFLDPGIQRALIVLGITAVYIAVLDFLGFIVATIIFMMYMMYLLKLRNMVKMFFVSLGTAVGVNFAFTGLLGIQLPYGLLDYFF